MSKLKIFLVKKGIKQKAMVEEINELAGEDILSQSIISQHHRGYDIGEKRKDKIMEYLNLKGLTPARSTIF